MAPLGILLVTSNGWGLGHLTRQLAIALAIGDRAETTMFSLSPGFPLAMEFGIKGEYCPSFTTQFIVRKEWDNYLQDRLTAFADEVRPDVLLFDGVAPYSGFMRAIAQLDCVVGWLRRGMWRDGLERASAPEDRRFRLRDRAHRPRIGDRHRRHYWC